MSSLNGKQNSTILTKREQEILNLIIQEESNQGISLQLDISIHTVETHRRNLLQKLNCKSSLGLMHWAIRNGFWEYKI